MRVETSLFSSDRDLAFSVWAKRAGFNGDIDRLGRLISDGASPDRFR